MSIFSKIFGDPNEKIIKSLQPIIDQINHLESEFKQKSDEELRAMTDFYKSELKEKKKTLDDILPQAFALVREAADRTLGMRHYDTQLIGGIILHRGQIAEMKTGEGKTLVVTLAAYLNALSAQGVHMITVNDYLARVGAGWMAPVYALLGMSTSVIIHDSAYIYDPEFSDEAQYDERLKHFRKISRREAYGCDITYGTNNEFGFDYLRDNMVSKLDEMVQRKLHFAIVDEVDSILIDEARTPLIISAPAEESTNKYYQFSELVKNLIENEDYNLDEKMRVVTLSEAGITKMEKLLGVENIYVTGGIREVHHIEQALKAHVLFQKERDYVVQDGEVIIVDEFTGRLMPGRRYSEGLHQAIEAKERVQIQRESRTLATITFQNYFRMYEKLAGMTGTAITEAEEFEKIYKLETVVIPTNKPVIRDDMNDLIYKSEVGKFKAVIEDVRMRSQAGQPILVGTISIEKNEMLAEMMQRAGLRPQVLNAKNHEKEAQIIAQAGKRGAITIATNMAGRGVDIVLGGGDDKEAREIRELGGLHVIGTERHESRRIDNQLRGRAGRQGDPGSSQFYVSTEDDLMRIFGGDRMNKLMTTLRVPEDMPIENKIISRSIESAQKKVEGNNFDTRKHIVKYDDVINKHRNAIYTKRRKILEAQVAQDGKVLDEMILEMLASEINFVVNFHTGGEDVSKWNLEEIAQTISTIFVLEIDLQAELEKIIQEVEEAKQDKEQIRKSLIDFIYELTSKNYASQEDKFQEFMSESGIEEEASFIDVRKGVLIRSIDNLWIEHLEAMSYMRQGIGLRGYGQRDPLVEYKKEAFRLYNELEAMIEKQVVYSIFKVSDISHFASPSILKQAQNFQAPSKVMEAQSGSFASYKQQVPENNSRADMVRDKVRDAEGNKVGRNDPCPCGSGKKYKKCHGK